MVNEIAPEKLKDRLDRGDAVQVIDIRDPPEFETGHIPGAENLPLDRLARDVDRHEWRDEIVVACARGNSSVRAARLLEAYEGVDKDASVINLTGGYQAWDYELEAGATPPDDD